MNPTALYQFAGIKSFGNGVFRSTERMGSDFSYRTLTRLRKCDLVYGKLMAWEGGIGIVPEECNGCVVSPEYPVFEIDEKVALPEFIGYYFRTKASWDQLTRASTGTNVRRRRVHPSRFLEIEVPLPPLAAQLKVVRLMESVDGARGRYEGLRAEQEAKMSAAVDSMIRRLSDTASWRPMGEVAPQVKRPVEIDPLQWYTEIGVRSFGNGTFQKDPVSGLSLGSKREFRIHSQDVVFSNVFAWEGAIAVASQHDNGIIGSHRFMTVVPDRGALLPEFLCAYCLSRRGIADVRAASPGGAGRNRTLGQKKLAQIRVPVPPMSDQTKVVDFLNKGRQIRRLAGENSALFVLAASTILDSAFRDADT